MASEKRLMTHYSSIREATLELKKFYKAGDLSNSLEICKALEKVDPKNKIAKKIKNKIIKMDPYILSLKEIDELYNNKEYEKAIVICEGLLERENHTSKFFNSYGALLKQVNQYEKSLFYLNKAIELNNKNIAAYFNKGLVLSNLKKYDEAIRVLEDLVNTKEYNPNECYCYYLLGMNYLEKNLIDKSTYYLEKSLSINNNFNSALINLANNYVQLDRLDKSVELLEKAKSIDFKNPLILYNLGNVYEKLERYDDAINALEETINIKHDFYQAHSNLGAIYKKQKKNNEKAIFHFDQAIFYNKNFDDAWNNKTSYLDEIGDLEEAQKCVEMAIKINPNNSDAYYNFGNVKQKFGDIAGAIQMYQKSIDLNNQKVDAKWNLAISNLLHGNLSDGWKQFEIRRQRKTWVKRVFNGKELRSVNQLNKGTSTVMVYSEQGLGDTIHFARFANLLLPYAKKIVLEVQKPIKLILSEMNDIDVVEKSSSIIKTDFHIPLLSIPKLLNIGFKQIPKPTLIKHKFEKEKNWKHIFKKNHINIGISWQGSQTHGDDKKVEKFQRSFPFTSFNYLKDLKNIHLISLQKKNENEKQLEKLEVPVLDLGKDFDNHEDAFIDTINILKKLDLVITCDTSLAHLAGSLNVPVWVGLKFVPDWRWFMNTESSLYYPSMKLFRQKSWGDWKSVFLKMKNQLEDFKNEQR